MTDETATTPAVEPRTERVCPTCGLPRWPGREDMRTWSPKQINAFFGARGIEARVTGAGMSDPMRSYSVTVTMTPRQAIEALDALRHAAVGRGSSRLFSASHRIASGLWDAGWDSINRGTEDDPKWTWRLPVATRPQES